MAQGSTPDPASPGSASHGCARRPPPPPIDTHRLAAWLARLTTGPIQDDDHTRAHDQGGITCECGLGPACRCCHQAKQAPGWRLEQPRPGEFIWQPPHGRRYPATPDTYPT